MKKTLLGLMLSATLLAGATLTAQAADTSNGTVGFEAGSLIIDNGDDGMNATDLDFGTNKITNSDETVTNDNSSAQITVNDLRGSNAGWNLGVSQDAQFTYTSGSKTYTLDNAAITLNGVLASTSTDGVGSTVNSGVLLTPGSGTEQLMSATSGNGNGKSVADISTSTLKIPGATAKVQGSYTTTLTWDLNSGVAND
ncbi:WxL domain-containing protein [Lactiplantibacillus fabifermentans]|uniref:Extracellular protein n=2 Tax=Lactiplantibacillus fabifermentans TaxID=483011 RepID=A0A0R2NH40_9LACO|nr:WxL domain-containing protein [Lactiplantibacillus fabifermentans]ETY73383.1 cell surface protein [Lactiplantibacillus fabifermentans T30PCM01]KRO25127.1 extracellular protein [Lactiplantibacillus fabifermentans DSM 21115]